MKKTNYVDNKTVKNIFKTMIMLFLITFLLSSCNVVFFEPSPEKLMSAPQTTKEQKEIYDVLKKDIDSDFIYKYPENGDYRYAYVYKPKNNENDEDEALVFFEKADENTGIKIEFIKKNKNKWEAIGSISGPISSIGIDKVEFANLDDNDETLEIIIGYNLSSSKKTFIIYKWETGIAEEIFEEKDYEDFKLIDKKDDGFFNYKPQQLLLFNGVFGTYERTIQLLTYENDNFILKDNDFILKSPVTEKFKVVVEEDEESTTVFVDQVWNEKGRPQTFKRQSSTEDLIPDNSETDNSETENSETEETGKAEIYIEDDMRSEVKELRTEVFIIKDGEINQILSDSWEITRRPFDFSGRYNTSEFENNAFFSRDINKDGVIEIPTIYDTERIKTVWDFDYSDGNKITPVSWFEINYKTEDDGEITGNLENVMYTIANENNDYHFIIPDDWLDSVIISHKEKGKYLNVITDGEGVTLEEVLSIYSEPIVNKDETPPPYGYEYVLESDLYIYYVRINNNLENKEIVQISMEEVKKIIIPLTK